MPYKILTIPFARDAVGAMVNVIPDDPISLNTNRVSWKEGFPYVTTIPLNAGGIPPEGQDFNGILKEISEHVVHQNMGGMYKFEQDVVDAGGYPKGAVLLADDETAIWLSLQDNNTQNFNTDPAGIWSKVAIKGLDDALDKKFDAINLVQSLGGDVDKVPSQRVITDAIVAAAGSGVGFRKPVPKQPLFEKINPTTIKIPAGLGVLVGNEQVVLDNDINIDISTNLPSKGTDCFVYMRDNATAYFSTNDNEVDGRLIGGFHYGLTGHAETPSGNKTEADMVKIRGINEYSFWDLTWRAKKHTNRGLVCIDGRFWVDIYLADDEYGIRGYSKAGGWIAGGEEDSNARKLPKIPIVYGGNGSTRYTKLTPFIAWDITSASGMELLSYQEFTHAMYGVDEGKTCQEEEVDEGRVEHYPSLTSRYGIEQATGTQFIWGRTFGSSSSGSWSNSGDGRGQLHSGIVCSLLGGRRNFTSGQPGSRCSGWDRGLTYSRWSHGLRGRCDILILDS